MGASNTYVVLNCIEKYNILSMSSNANTEPHTQLPSEDRASSGDALAVAFGVRAELAGDRVCLFGSPEAAEQSLIILLYYP